MEKERYEVKRLNYGLDVKLTDNYEPHLRYIIFNDVSDSELAKLETVCNFLNQQNKRIKELENLINLGNQKLSDFYWEKVDELDKEYNEHLEELTKQYDDLNKKYCEEMDKNINLTEQLKQQLAVIEKALELACMHMCKYVIPCPNNNCGMLECYKDKADCYFKYFEKQAREMLENENIC